jgi:hypothetical protein
VIQHTLPCSRVPGTDKVLIQAWDALGRADWGGPSGLRISRAGLRIYRYVRYVTTSLSWPAGVEHAHLLA